MNRVSTARETAAPPFRPGVPGRGATALILCLLCTAVACAQGSDWPEYPLPGPHGLDRASGLYLSWVKLLILIGIFLGWVQIVAWVNDDCQIHDFAYAVWVLAVFLPFVVALPILGLTVPLFAIGASATGLSVLVPALIYVVHRNKQLEHHERVLTPEHLRFLLAAGLQRLGVKISAEKKAAHEKGAPVVLAARGGSDEQANQANLIAARQSPGFLPAKALLANAIDHRAEKIMLDFTAQSVATRYQVDGVWHDSDEREREEGDQLLQVLKHLSALEPRERRARQQGKFHAEYEKQKLDCTLLCQGTQTGERVIVTLAGKGVSFASLAELGMRDKMIGQLKSLMLSDNGFLVFSAMKGGGVTTTLTLSLKSTDRLLRDFIALEDEAHRLPDVENVDPVFYSSAKGESPAGKLPTVLRKQPDVLVVPELPDLETLKLLCDAAKEQQLVFVTMPAKEAVEALIRILMLKIPAKEFAPRVRGVLNQRLIRKLCEHCKEAYEPPAALLAKLGIPAGRVDQLYRHPENPETVCPECHGIGYKGRTAIFELLTVDDTVREVMIQQPKLDIMRKAARKAGSRTLQEEGLLAVVQGITSLPELMRVLKQ